ncbi:MAG: 4-alpha-glucanotransferase, partial [Clostridia bacterium]|nr:4-alpha-glucanotransferase [Clostridia bacterium]
DALVAEGLLEPGETARDWGGDPLRVDYGRLYENRFAVLRLAYERALLRPARMEGLQAFSLANGAWLEDYALFMALKDHYAGRPWTEWPRVLRLREPAALEAGRAQHAARAGFYRFIQMLFFEQWDALKRYAGSRGVKIIGDLPIYVPLDSADVWAAPEQFQLDDNRLPTAVAGVPPDYFSADGQLWGNPLYDWAHMRQNGYAWWMRRIMQASRLFDTLRIDHFRGLASYWAVPYGAKTARDGAWLEGPGLAFVRALKESFPALEIIAEDLGFMTPDVVELVRASGLPNMKVLQFAFDAGDANNNLPHAYERRCVCYTGTHDNATVLGWYAGASADDRRLAARYLGLSQTEGLHWGFIRGGMASVADLFVAQMQDYLGLGDEARMNLPGTVGGNWLWRMEPDVLRPALAERIAEYTRIFGRLAPA